LIGHGLEYPTMLPNNTLFEDDLAWQTVGSPRGLEPTQTLKTCSALQSLDENWTRSNLLCQAKRRDFLEEDFQLLPRAQTFG
jgi:hypothetical protein